MRIALKIGIFCFFAVCLIACSISGECDFEETVSAKSPDGNYIVQGVDVGCGATTGFVSWIIVRHVDERLDVESQNIAVLKGQVSGIDWTRGNEISVSGDLVLHKIVNHQYNLSINK